MRERYQKNGAPLELPTNMKKHLGVVEPSQWTMAKLKVIQNKVITRRRDTKGTDI